MTKLMIVSLVTLALPFWILTHSSVQDDPQTTFEAFLQAERNHDLIQLVQINGSGATKMNSKIEHNKEELRSKLSPQMTSVAYWARRQNQ